MELITPHSIVERLGEKTSSTLSNLTLTAMLSYYGDRLKQICICMTFENQHTDLEIDSFLQLNSVCSGSSQYTRESTGEVIDEITNEGHVV